MGKLRVYQLARELNKSSKDLVEILHDLGVDVASHMSTVENETAELIRGMYLEVKEKVKEKEKEKVKEKKKIKLSVPVTVKELSQKINQPVNSIIKTLMQSGVMATINYPLDKDALLKLGDNIDLEIEIEESTEEKQDNEMRIGPRIIDKPEDLQLRPPIVTVMGHVDHGKTTLLDAIRKTSVAESEVGGITQHIGAYQVDINNKKITFIDTPGHEAFTAMRARGAQITDITILVVAADDGVMPQTIEAINHAKAANIPIIVAINKIDRPNAQPDRVMQELTDYGLVPEKWGGDVICVPISALKGEHIDELLEMVLLVSEIEEIVANPDRAAEGVVIESELDKGRGPVATLLIKNGTLHISDCMLVGATHARVRAMINDQGKRINQALPSTPVEVLGFSDIPAAGDFFQVLEDEKIIRKIAEKRMQQIHKKNLQPESRVSLEDLYKQIQEGNIKELNVIIKADVNGSIEALRDSLLKLGTEEVTVNIIHDGVGAINETDVNLASASNAIIIGFNVRPDNNARIIAEKERVDIRLYRVIYKVLEDLKDALSGLLDPELKEEVVARAEIRDTFKVPNVGVVAGLYVTEGVINRNNNVRLIRDGIVIHEGNISSLKRFENDVREVREDYECGLGIEGYNDIKIGDELEIYIYREIKRSL